MQQKYIARPFVAGSEDALVLGQAVEAFASNLNADTIRALLPKYGFSNIDPNKWYPHQDWLDLLKEIDDSSTYVAFGKKVVETVAMPPELETIPDVLNALHDIHHLNLRNIPEDEGYVIEKVSDNHYHVFANTPNPDHAIYGFIWGICHRYRAKGESFTVKIIDNFKEHMIPGTLYEIKWGPEA